MNRLSKEDYNNAKNCLKRYNYNCINIMNIQSDILSLSVAPADGQPRAPYWVSNPVLSRVIKLEENEDIQRSIREYKAVQQALQVVKNDCKYIFEEMYIKGKYRWEIIGNGISERTFERRYNELIYAVDKELKKIGGKLAEF